MEERGRTRGFSSEQVGERWEKIISANRFANGRSRGCSRGLADYTIAKARLKKITKNENSQPFLRSFPYVPFLFYCDPHRKSRRKYSSGTIRMKDDHIRRPKLSEEKEIPTAADTPKRITT